MEDNIHAVNKFKNMTVSIVGLGFIGSSIARALRHRIGITRIIAIDRDENSVAKAVRDGVACCGFTGFNEKMLDSDLVFLCTPVRFAAEYLPVLAPNVKPGCIITDVGSTKSQIMEVADALPSPVRFIGGHPMAGSEKVGYEAGFSHLFENAYYILTPGKYAQKEDVEFMSRLVQGIGALPVILGAKEHDKVTGSISHLPHIIAFTLVNLVKELDGTDGKMQMLAAGGFKDITRIASSNPEMWENIVLSNKQQIGEILEKYLELLNKVKQNIESADSKVLYQFFESARNYRNTFAESKKGLIPPLYEIVVDVEDQPGIIGEIATILGKNNINIKNIQVSNSREFEQGVLKVSLSSTESAAAAVELLSREGYRVYRI